VAIDKWNEMQLGFDLDLDELAEDAEERAISPEEARLISEAARQAFESQPALLEEDGGWKREYVRLREQGWPWRIACYIAWAASPRQGRWPETLSKLATDVLGLRGPRTIHTWRKKHPSLDAVVAMLQAAPLFEHRRDVINALIQMATTPDYKAFNDRKLFLEMIGDYVPKSQLSLKNSGKANDLSELSDAELDLLAGEIAERRNLLEDDDDRDDDQPDQA
jgi:hypothetical protein